MVEEKWLRETVDQDLGGLFTEDRDAIAATVSRVLERLPFDRQLENSMIDALQASLDLGHDDTNGSVWLALLLGEAAVVRGIPVLLQALASDDDEELQHAAGIALLKCGEPGIDGIVAVLEDDEPAQVFVRAALEWLAYVGYLRNDDLVRKVQLFLTDMLDGVSVPAESRELIEGVARAASWLGHTDLAVPLEHMQKQLGEVPSPAITDALEMLEDNGPGVTVVGELLPGEEEYSWAFDYDAASFRAGGDSLEVVATADGAAEVSFEDEASQEMRDLDQFLRGAASGGPVKETED